MTRNKKSDAAEFSRVTLKERVFRMGYVVRTERATCGGTTVDVDSAYTPNGEYIGSPKDARYLCRRGIRPQLRTPTSGVCSIGYCASERKWYGWSHRAIFGFGVGSVVRKGSCCADGLPIGFRAKAIADAKRMAEVFAESVS